MRSVITVPISSSYPATSGNRSRASAIAEMLAYVGGESAPEAQSRAGRAFDAAVREYNTVAWRFNRLTQDITLSSTAGTADYTLETDFRSPLNATVLDNSGDSVDIVTWVPYERWRGARPDQSGTGSQPELYTVRNEHQTGVVTFDPPTSGTNTHPTVQIDYHRRILVQSGSGSVLNVPLEVDEAIFQLALSKVIAMIIGHKGATDARILAQAIRNDVERLWRDFDEQGN
jgi:hypothetical protein